jgi:hypothetical protein
MQRHRLNEGRRQRNMLRRKKSVLAPPPADPMPPLSICARLVFKTILSVINLCCFLDGIKWIAVKLRR